MAGGRPTEAVPQEFADEVVAWISEGKTLREYCRQPGKPSYCAVYDWEKKDDEFKQRIARARDIGEDVIAQECLTIADDATNDWMEEKHGEDEKSAYNLNGEHIQRSKLRIDTRLKLLSKWNPRKYGDKLQTELSGPDGGKIPVSLEIDL